MAADRRPVAIGVLTTLAFGVALSVYAGQALAPQAAPAPPPAQVGGTRTAPPGGTGTPQGTPAANADLHSEFRVRFVQQDAAYLDGGYAAGLAEGMKLLVKGPPPGTTGADPSSAAAVAAELVIVAVAHVSAVAEIRSPTRPVVAGDRAVLSPEAVQTLVNQQALSDTRRFPAVLSFTEGGDALDDEARADVPRPPLPSSNRARGRFGFDYLGFSSLDGGGMQGRNLGLMFQGTYTGIGGSDWTLSGYWRGRLHTTSSALQPTLQDLINRTYHLSLTHDTPTSSIVAGVGRLYLPWATSLETLDGGYVATRLTPQLTTGAFGGSSPDPTSYNYNPNLGRAGGFVNLTEGSFDKVRYSGTAGVGADFRSWQLDRPFLFTENSVNAGQTLAVYHALQVDNPSGTPATSAPGRGVGRSFLTVHWNPHPRVQIDGNDTYFRDVPTFDPTLIGTGLLDKYLFQGYSGGVRVEVVRGASVYTELGRSNRTGDTSDALNAMIGVTLARVPGIGARVDAHYSRFSSAFGRGDYQAVSVTRNFNDRYRLDVLAGNQTFASPTTSDQSARFVTTTVDLSLAGSLFVSGSVTIYRGALQNYNQGLVTFGYQFNTKRSRP